MHPARQISGADQSNTHSRGSSRSRLDLNSPLRVKIQYRLQGFRTRIAQQYGQAIASWIDNGFIGFRRVVERKLMSDERFDLDASR